MTARTVARPILVGLAPLVAVLLLTISCKSSELPGTWSAVTIQTDGEISDWEGVPSLLLEDAGAALRIANDSTHLYLLMQLRDAQMARVIHMSGIKIWLNNKGNKDKYFMLHYTGGPSQKEMAAAGMVDTLRRGGPPDMQMGGGPGRQPENGLTCYIEDRLAEKSIPLDGSQGPSAASGIKDGVIYYEFVIPLSETEVQSYGLGSHLGSDIGLGVIWGEIDRDAMREQMGAPPGGMGGGMPPGGMGGGGGRGGGMGGPGGGGPPGGQRPSMPEKQEVWLRSTLATGSSEQ
ncbi:MAG: hypothetical protein ABIJ61_00625 [bacterium]